MPGPLLFYVRHGETEWNRAGRLQGQHDSDLTPLGQLQAVRSAEILRELWEREGRSVDDFDYVASPLGRARATMERIRETLGLAPGHYHTDPRLQELAFGRWEGRAYYQLQANEPDVLAERERDKWNFAPPGGESYAALMTRVGAWHATVRRDSVVVAHGGTGRALVALMRVAAPEKACAFDIDQGVVYVFAAGQFARYG